MIPVSTVKLKCGDVSFIERADGRYVPFVFLCGCRGKRSAFYGGTLKVVLNSPEVQLIPPTVVVNEYALLHIACYKENHMQIVGNVASNIGESTIASIEEKVTYVGVGAIHSVWGSRTLTRHANAVVP